MAAPEKKQPSVLGLDTSAGKDDPSAWRPSQAREQDQGPQPRSDAQTGNRERLSSWRPSKANEERLSSLSPLRRRRRLALPPGARLLLTFVFFVCCAYFLLKLWFMPEAGDLHPVLAIAAVVLILLFASAVIGAVARRRSKSSDEKSILRL
jgi:hypothetical protein